MAEQAAAARAVAEVAAAQVAEVEVTSRRRYFVRTPGGRRGDGRSGPRADGWDDRPREVHAVWDVADGDRPHNGSQDNSIGWSRSIGSGANLFCGPTAGIEAGMSSAFPVANVAL